MPNQAPLSSAPPRQYMAPNRADLDFNFPYPLPPEEPSEVIASWNAANAFSGDHWRDALDLALQQRAGAMYIAEFMKRDSTDGGKKAFKARMGEIQAALHGTGYAVHIQDMTPDDKARNAHWQAVIAREDPNVEVTKAAFSERKIFIVNLGKVATRAYFEHAPDASTAARLVVAKKMRVGFDQNTGRNVGYIRHREVLGHESDGIIVGGDLNAMAEDDPGSRLPRLARRVFGRLLGRMLEGRDLYDERKRLQRWGGKVMRLANMADESLAELKGLQDVDSTHEPTIHQGKLVTSRHYNLFQFQLDHFMASNNVAVVPGTYQVREPRIHGGSRLSDHDIIRMAMHRAHRLAALPPEPVPSEARQA